MKKNWLLDDREEIDGPPVIYLVVPCYNEEEVLEVSKESIEKVWKNHMNCKVISHKSKVVFCDDGSKDGTWEIICKISKEKKWFEGIRLSRNCGHQIALLAGTEYAIPFADAIITIDADLQQDIDATADFINLFKENYDIVYGIRNDRKTDKLLKRKLSTIYYKLLKILGVDIVPQSADYRLLSKRAAKALLMHEEGNLFVRGLIPTIGFKSAAVHFDVKEREAGSSKYTFKKMMQLALDGITSFSIKPIRMVLFMGVMISFASIIMMIYAVTTYFCGETASGWASLSASIWFLGGCQLVGIGIIGEYVGRTYLESKKRPRYFIEDYTQTGSKTHD